MNIDFYSCVKFITSGYGKLAENIKRYSNTIIGDETKLQKKQASPFFKSANFLEMENGETGSIEISMTPKKLYDNKPVVMGSAILANSKLHFLKFIYEVVYRFFIPGSYKLCYCDTDSIAIGIVLFCLRLGIYFFFSVHRFESSD